MKTYEKEFKEEVVKLSYEIGAEKAAESLGVKVNTLYGWRSGMQKHKGQAFVGSGNKRQDATSAETAKLLKEIKELKRANEILKAALGFFAESQKR